MDIGGCGYEVCVAVGMGCGMCECLAYGVLECLGVWRMSGNQLLSVAGIGLKCVSGNQPEQAFGEGEKSIREFFTKIHQTP